MTDQSKHDHMPNPRALVERLNSFNDGPVDLTDLLAAVDDSADALTAALDEIERMRRELEDAKGFIEGVARNINLFLKEPSND